MKKLFVLTALAATLNLTASFCAHAEAAPQPSTKPLAERANSNEMSVMVVPDPDSVLGLGKAPQRQMGRRVLDLDDVLKETGDPLPDLQVGKARPVDINTDSVADAIDTVLRGTGVSFTLDSGFGDTKIPIQVYGFQGSLKDAIEEISEVGGFFWTYDAAKKRIRVRPVKSITLQLPPHDELVKDLKEGFQTFGATDIVVNQASKLAIMRVNRLAAKEISDFSRKFRKETPLLMFTLSVESVRVSDGFDFASIWSNVVIQGKNEGNGTSIVSDVAKVIGGVSTASVFTLGRVSVATATSFLKTQADSRTLVQTSLTGISGTKGASNDLVVEKVIEEVTSTPSTDGKGQPTVTVKTSEHETGTKLTIVGSYTGGNITADLDVSIIEKAAEDKITKVGDTEINRTTDSRKTLKVKVQMAPGETVLLQGFRKDAATNSKSGVNTDTFLDAFLPGTKNRKAESTEVLVILRAEMQTLDEYYNAGNRR